MRFMDWTSCVISFFKLFWVFFWPVKIEEIFTCQISARRLASSWTKTWIDLSELSIIYCYMLTCARLMGKKKTPPGGVNKHGLDQRRRKSIAIFGRTQFPDKWLLLDVISFLLLFSVCPEGRKLGNAESFIRGMILCFLYISEGNISKAFTDSKKGNGKPEILPIRV